MKYLGHLPQNDPLFHYLRHDIFPQIGMVNPSPVFEVYQLKASNHVYLYKDIFTQTNIVGKFFGGGAEPSVKVAFHRMEREFSNLNHLREIGFSHYPHYVVRPLGHNSWLNCVLVEEFCHGILLSGLIFKAIQKGNANALYQKLTALAYFLATMHNRTANGMAVDFNKDCSYFDKIAEELRSWGHIGWEEFHDFQMLKEKWRERSFMWADQQVLVHGDATPSNFLFGEGLQVIAVDLERMKWADRVFDVGRLAGEIKHFFMQYAGNKALAEPFIGHFLWEYACHFPDRERAFDSITRRVPFYMGLTLLRIARNSWINRKYRRTLLNEANDTLR